MYGDLHMESDTGFNKLSQKSVSQKPSSEASKLVLVRGGEGME